MSPSYRLTSGAESDVRKILEYTLERWGPKQAAKYALLLEDAIEKLAARELDGRGFSTNLPDVRVHRCEHQYIFFQPGDQSLLVLAILHKSMDLTTRLRERLGDLEPEEAVAGQVTGEVTGEVKKLLEALCSKPLTRAEAQAALNLQSQANFRDRYLIPALGSELIERTIPDKPNSRLQKYRLTAKGKALLGRD